MTNQQTTDKQNFPSEDEIQELLKQGDDEELAQRLNALLEDLTAEQARLLQAEINLAKQREPEFVGESAQRYRARTSLSEREQRIVEGAEAWAANDLAAGRDLLPGDITKGVKRLRRAQALTPWDASTSLAAAFILSDALDMISSEYSEDKLSLLDDLPRYMDASLQERMWRKARTELQNALRQTLETTRERAEPGDYFWREAALMLIDVLTETGDVEPLSAVLEEARSAGLEGASDRYSRLQARRAETGLQHIATKVRLMLRLNEAEQAASLLERALVAAPESDELWLLTADWLQMNGHTENAVAVYQWLMYRPEADSPTVIDPTLLHSLEDEADRISLHCPRCRRPLSGPQCGSCGFDVPDVSVPSVHNGLPDLNDTRLAAKIGLALLIDADQQPARVYRCARSALQKLTSSHPAYDRLKERHDDLESKIHADRFERSLARMIADFRAGRTRQAKRRLIALDKYAPENEKLIAWRALIAASGPLNAHAQQHIESALKLDASTWAHIPLTDRNRFVGAMLLGGKLSAVHGLLPALYTEDERQDRRVADLITRCEQMLGARCDALTTSAREELDAGRVDKALQTASKALDINPEHTGAMLVRGQARLQSGAIFPAAEDFSTLWRQATGETHMAASLGLAQVYTALGDMAEAQRMLARIDQHTADSKLLQEAMQLGEQLARRQLHRPAVLVQRAHPMWEEQPRGYQAVFAVEVAAAARWRADDSLSLPRAEILRAGQDFVSMLGGLINAPGKPAFSLRIVSEPEPDHPADGRLRIAVLCTVTHSIAEEAEHLALELWHVLRSQLPLAHAAVYQYEPVFDEEALRWWLRPFPLRDVAEIVRRETVLSDGAHVVYPFTSGGTPLVNMARVLLNQQAPAMVSIHLEPTALDGEELVALVDNLGRLQQIDLPLTENEDRVDVEQPQARRYLIDPERTSQLDLMAKMRRSLEGGGFALRICTASASPNNHLLPHAIAADLLGPGGRWEVFGRGRAFSKMLRRGLREMAYEPWTPSAVPLELKRLRFLVSEAEAGLIFRLPMPDVEGIPGLPQIDVKPVLPTVLPTEGIAIGETVAVGSTSPRMVQIRQSDRRRHAYVVGKTGVGKSTLLEGMVLQDIEEGRGVAVLDPHGDLVESILRHIPAHRANDVIIFDPSDEQRPVGLNFLEAETESQRHRIATEFIQLLMKLYDPGQTGIVGPRFQHNVRNAMLTVMEAEPNATLIELVRTLTDSSYVQQLLPKVSDPLVRNYWTRQIANTSDFHKSEILDYIVSKFNRFVGDKLVRNIVGQSRSTLDFRSIMDEKKILLVNLSKGKIGPDNAEFLGFLLLQSLLIAALSRAEQAQQERSDFCLYVDEFQTFATESFAAMLSEGRKYGLCLVMANQYLSQLTPSLRQAVFGNVGTLIAFQVGMADAHLLAEEFYPVFSTDDLMNVPRYTAAVRPLVDGVTTRPFAMRTRLVRHLPDASAAATIKEASRMRYGRAVDDITQEVNERFVQTA